MMLKGERDVALAEQAKVLAGGLPARSTAQQRANETSRITTEFFNLLKRAADLEEELEKAQAQLEKEREVHAEVKSDRDTLQSMVAVDEQRLRSRVGWLLDNACQATWLTISDAPPHTTEVKVEGKNVIGATIDTPYGTFAYNLDDGLLKVVPKPTEEPGEKTGEKRVRPELDLRVDRKGILLPDELALGRYLDLLPSRVTPRFREFIPKERFGPISAKTELVSPETLRDVLSILRNKMGMEVVPATWVGNLRMTPMQL